MKIIPVSEKDLPGAIALLRKSNLPTDDLPGITQLFILEHDTAIAGTAGIEYSETYGLLRSLCISEDHRNHGWGKELVTFIEDFAKNHGVHHLYLLTTTAEEFFKQLRYRKTKRAAIPDFIRLTREFSDVCPDSAIIMKKTLR